MKISIIVPAYNTEKYIQRCVDSILDRTFRDFERGCRNQFLRDSEVLTDKDRAYFDSVSDHMSEAEATISLHRMCDFPHLSFLSCPASLF